MLKEEELNLSARADAYSYAAFCVNKNEPIRIDEFKRLFVRNFTLLEILELRGFCQQNIRQHSEDHDNLGAKLAIVLINRKLQRQLQGAPFNN